jgi:hypothetical protein
MKQSCIMILSALLVTGVFSCQKNGSKMVTLSVVEYKTNKPIEGATITLTGLESFNLNCVCFPRVTIAAGQTDVKGNCQFSEDEISKAVYDITVTKDKYIGTDGTNISKYEMSLVGYLRMHLVKINSFPDAYQLGLSMKGEQGNGYTGFYLTDGFPADTTLIMSVYGGQTNTLSLDISNSSSQVISRQGPFSVNVGTTDTANYEIKY